MTRIPLLAAFMALLLLSPPARAESAGGTVARGEYLARAGDCVACHSAPGGKAFAGGLKMGTPLGALFATNITPDAKPASGPTRCRISPARCEAEWRRTAATCIR
jgi:mono/diheme cytochrome c family protein